MRSAYDSGSPGSALAETIIKQLQGRRGAETRKDFALETLLGVAHVTGRRVAWLIQGELPEFEGGAMHEQQALAQEIAAHLGSAVRHTTEFAIQRRQFFVDGTRALDLLTTAAREHLLTLQAQYEEDAMCFMVESAATREQAEWIPLVRKARAARERRELAALPLAGLVVPNVIARENATTGHVLVEIQPTML